MDQFIIDEVPHLYRVIALHNFRRTPGVYFDVMPHQHIPRIDAIDRVIHEGGALSPGPVGDVARPWYMHPAQDDNLIVLQGKRYVDIYTAHHGTIERFEVTPHHVTKNGVMLYQGEAVLVWPRGVFHRIESDADTGSASINLATHYDGFDIKTNFNIYALDDATGRFHVIRKGHLDQKPER
jgi:hypothetical protein